MNHGIYIPWEELASDCSEPLCIGDDKLTASNLENRHLYPKGADSPFCSMTFFCSRIQLARMQSRVLRELLGTRRPTLSDILQLDAELTQWHERVLPKCFLPESPLYDPATLALSELVHLGYLRLILLIHRPFIGHPDLSPQSAKCREKALDIAIEMLESYKRLHKYGYLMLGYEHSFHALLAEGLFIAPVALAVDLYVDPHQAKTMQIQQALLDIRSIYISLLAVPVPVGRLYTILTLLMQKAWEKAGLLFPDDGKHVSNSDESMTLDAQESNVFPHAIMESLLQPSQIPWTMQDKPLFPPELANQDSGAQNYLAGNTGIQFQQTTNDIDPGFTFPVDTATENTWV